MSTRASANRHPSSLQARSPFASELLHAQHLVRSFANGVAELAPYRWLIDAQRNEPLEKQQPVGLRSHNALRKCKAGQKGGLEDSSSDTSIL